MLCKYRLSGDKIYSLIIILLLGFLNMSFLRNLRRCHDPEKREAEIENFNSLMYGVEISAVKNLILPDIFYPGVSTLQPATRRSVFVSQF